MTGFSNRKDYPGIPNYNKIIRNETDKDKKVFNVIIDDNDFNLIRAESAKDAKNYYREFDKNFLEKRKIEIKEIPYKELLRYATFHRNEYRNNLIDFYEINELIKDYYKNKNNTFNKIFFDSIKQTGFFDKEGENSEKKDKYTLDDFNSLGEFYKNKIAIKILNDYKDEVVPKNRIRTKSSYKILSNKTVKFSNIPNDLKNQISDVTLDEAIEKLDYTNLLKTIFNAENNIFTIDLKSHILACILSGIKKLNSTDIFMLSLNLFGTNGDIPRDSAKNNYLFIQAIVDNAGNLDNATKLYTANKYSKFKIFIISLLSEKMKHKILNDNDASVDLDDDLDFDTSKLSEIESSLKETGDYAIEKITALNWRRGMPHEGYILYYNDSEYGWQYLKAFESKDEAELFIEEN